MSKRFLTWPRPRPTGSDESAQEAASRQPPGKAGALPGQDRRVNLDPEDLKNGLAGLVLTLVKLLHELLEKQAIRRIEAGLLDDRDCERVGLALMRQNEQIQKLSQAFGLAEDDLNIDLGPLGKLI